MPVEQPPEAMVPVWALNLTATMSEIKAKVEAIPGIKEDLRNLRKEMVPMGEHVDTRERVDKLWDVYNNQQGELKGRRRGEAWWRFALTTAIAILAMWLGVRTAGIHP